MISPFQQQISAVSESLFYAWGAMWLAFMLALCCLCLISVVLMPIVADFYVWIVKAIERYRR